MSNYQPQILQTLLAQNARDSLQALDGDDLARQLGVTWAELRPDVTYLAETGLLILKTRQIRTRLFHSLYLTAKGIAWLEGRLPDAAAAAIASEYNLQNIRALLNEGFSDVELRRLCYDEPAFRPVYDQLAQTTGKDVIIDHLLEYTERKRLFDHLLALVRELNPSQYEKHQPYQNANLP
jgi:hypothetical protein